MPAPLTESEVNHVSTIEQELEDEKRLTAQLREIIRKHGVDCQDFRRKVLEPALWDVK